MRKPAKIVAIGGGEIGELETLPMDREIVRLSGKKRPNALFIPTASGDSEAYWETFKGIYGKKLGCRTDVLFLLKGKVPRKEMRRRISSADIIYVGGGNTLRMIRAWRKLGVDKLLREAWRNGVVMSGISAGAMCWFAFGTSDSRKYWKKPNGSPMRVSGMGFVPLLLSPHHRRERRWRDAAIRRMMRRTAGVGIALDDRCALEITGDAYKVISSGAKKIYFSKGKLVKKILGKRGTLASLISKN